MKKLNAVIVVLIVLAILIVCIGSRGGGGSAKSCVSVTVDVCGEWEVKGTITNNCSKTVRYVLVQSTGYSSSGDVIDRDPEYVEDISAGGHKYFESPLDTSTGKVARCRAEIEEAQY